MFPKIFWVISDKENKFVEIIKFLNKSSEKYILIETIIKIINEVIIPAVCNKDGNVTHPLPIADANKFITP